MKDSGSTRKLYSVPVDSQQKTLSVNFLSYDLIHRLKIRPDCGTTRQSSYSSPTPDSSDPTLVRSVFQAWPTGGPGRGQCIMQARPRSSTLADALSRIVSRTSLRISLRIDRLPPPPTRLLGEHAQKEGDTVSMSAGLIAIVYPAMRLINKQTAHVHVISFESELLRTSSAPRVMFCCVAYLPNIIVDIYVRTVSHSNPVFRYPAAYETADLGRPHQASTIRCKQIPILVGA